MRTTVIHTQAQILNTLTRELQQAAALTYAGDLPTERDFDNLVDVQVAVEDLRGALDGLAAAMAAVPPAPTAGARLKLSADRIRAYAAEADDAPDMTSAQAQALACALVGV